MSNFSKFQTLTIIEDGEKSWIEFKQIFTKEDALQDLQNLMNYLEDYSNAKLVIFSNLDQLSYSLNSVDEFRHWEKTIERLSRLRMISIAVIDGLCKNVNLQLATTCDFRIASNISIFQILEVKEGYLPGMLTFRLAKFVGLGIAKRMLFMGLPYNAEDAYKIGLIDMVFSKTSKDTMLEKFLNSLLPIRSDVIQLTRRLLDESYSNSYDEAIGHFIAAQYKCINQPPKT